MIEMLKNDDVINRIGGRFKLTALMQKRWIELMQGARPTVESTGKTALEVIAQEILEGKIMADAGDSSGSGDADDDAEA